MKHPFSRRHLYVMIACCTMSAAAFGILINASGVFFTPIADDFQTGRGNVAMMLTICNICLAVSSMFTSAVLKKLPLKPVMVLVTIFFSGATAALSLAKNLPVLYVLSALRGIAAGIAGNVMITLLINNWFIRHNATFISIAMAFSGLGGAAFSPVFTRFISLYGWRNACLLSAAAILLLELPSILLPVSLRPEDKGLLPFGQKTPAPEGLTADASPALSAESPSKSKTPDAAASGKTTPFLLVFLALLFSALVSFATAFPQHFPGIAANLGHSESVGALLVSLSLIMNTGGKLVFGVLTDRFGAKKTILLYSSLLLLGIIVLIFLHGTFWLITGALLLGLSFSLGGVAAAVLVRTVFSREAYGRIYPKANLAGTASNAVSAAIVGFLYDGTGNYTLAFVLLAFLILAEIAGVLLIFRKSEN